MTKNSSSKPLNAREKRHRMEGAHDYDTWRALAQ